MADDIDDLLDECETKFCGNSKSSSQNHPNKTNSRSSKKATRNEKIGTKRFVVFFFLIELVYLSHVYYVYLFIRAALQFLCSF